jgi:hypothetical protein
MKTASSDSDSAWWGQPAATATVPNVVEVADSDSDSDSDSSDSD